MRTGRLPFPRQLTRLTKSLWSVGRDFRYEIGVFVFSLILFRAIVTFVNTDIRIHLHIVQGWVDGTLPLPANFLFYSVVYALAFFKNDIQSLYWAAVVALSVAVMLKYAITRGILNAYLVGVHKKTVSPGILALTSFLLILAFSLPTWEGIKSMIMGLPQQLYVGQIPPNVWHNSTTIFLMPAALLLFWTSYRQILSPKKSRIWLISVLVVVSLLIKPNFFLAFVVAYPLVAALRMGLNRSFCVNVLPPVVLGVLVLGIQYYFLFVGSPVSIAGAGVGGVSISLFHVWSAYSENIPISILASAFFPLVYLCFHWRQAGKNLLLQYALSLYAVALLIFSVFSETGDREFHGNFFWQGVVCGYILFMAVGMLLMRRLLRRRRESKEVYIDMLAVGAFLVHVVAGIVYLGAMLTSGSPL